MTMMDRKKFDAWTRETMKTANVSTCSSSGLNPIIKGEELNYFSECTIVIYSVVGPLVPK